MVRFCRGVEIGLPDTLEGEQVQGHSVAVASSAAAAAAVLGEVE